MSRPRLAKLAVGSACGVIVAAYYMQGFGQVLWGDGAIVVAHFSDADSLLSALLSGFVETGQGKWRPLTYMSISVLTYLGGATALGMFIITSALFVLFGLVLLWLCQTILESCFDELLINKTILSTCSTVGFLMLPGFRYSIGSPFGIMEISGACLALLGIQSLLARSKNDSGDTRLGYVYVPSSCFFLATLFHERYVFALLSLLIIDGLNLWRAHRNDSVLVSDSRLVEGRTSRGVNSFSVDRLFVSLVLVGLYLNSRILFDGGRLVTTGGEAGSASWEVTWIVAHFIWAQIFVVLWCTRMLLFESHSIFPIVPSLTQLIAISPIALFFVAAITRQIFEFVQRPLKHRNFQDLRRFTLILLTFSLLSSIPAALVVERIETRWMVFPGLLLLLTILLHVFSWSSRQSGVAVSFCAVSAVSFFAVGWLVGSDRLNDGFVSMREVQDTLERSRISADTEYVAIKGASSGSTSWAFGYGRAFELFLQSRLDDEFEGKKIALVSVDDCKALDHCVEVMYASS